MSSPCYVFAIVRRDAPLPSVIGGGHRDELAMVPWRQLAAVTRRVEEPSHLTMEAVLQHELVVEAVREMGPALPVRFGTVFSHAASVASALADRYESLEADLDRLGDKAEMSLTALWCSGVGRDVRETGGGEGSAGAQYLRARAVELEREKALRDRARSLLEKLDEALGDLTVERRASMAPTPRIALRASYLIDPSAARDFQAAFEGARREQPEFRMLLTGPWPPYSFAAPPECEGFFATNRGAVSLAQVLTDAMQDRRGESAAACSLATE